MRGILLLGIEVSHRLFSLRWLVPLSPHRTKTRFVFLSSYSNSSSLRILRDESKAASHCYDELTRTRSLNWDQSIGTRSGQNSSAHFVNVSAVSQRRRISQARNEGQVGMSANAKRLLLAAFIPVAS